MRRTLFLGTAAGAGLVGLALGFMPWGLPVERAFGGVAARLRDLSGLTVRAGGGTATLRLLPRPTLALAGVDIRFADGSPALAAKEMTIGLRLAPLLLGGFEAATLRIDGLTLRAASAEAGDAWREAGRRFVAARVAPDARSGGAAPERIEIADGTVVIGDEARAFVFTELAGRVTWRGADAAIAASVGGRLRGQRVAASLAGFSPGLLRGGRSPFGVRFESPLLTVTTDGEMTAGGDVGATGRFALDTPALAEMAAWLDVPAPLSTLVPAVSVKGTGVIGFAGFDLPQAEVMVGRDRLEGSLALRLGEGAPQLSGTLAATTLDASAIAPLALRLFAGDSEPIGAARLGEADLDLRLSANQANLRGVRLDDVALSAVLKRGRLELSLGRARIGGGALRGRITALVSDRGLELKSNGSLVNVDAAAALRAVAGPVALSGQADGEYALDAVGRTSRELIASLLGSLDLRLERGEIGGVDIAAWARRLIDRADAEAPPKGRTPFASARFGATLWSGVAELKAVEMRGPGFGATAFGRISLPDADMDITGTFAPEALAGANAAPTFRLTGPWRQPALTITGTRP